ncbi:MAG: mannose-1-phosphate guanylyltransferase/mannose-6-phosphate isomerase [Gammaproteobacteria bacterium]|nr:mannose-1-phosphate guanylyltransferase/mannose-6-phosphate isomerase [Gammaproteobacteria bacterium]
MESKVIPVILCGGSGTRLWPLSRRDYPKQFLKLLGQHSLLQETVLRASALTPQHPPLVVCNNIHRFLVHAQLGTLGIQAAQLLLEPEGRNTAPALAVAALHMSHADPDALLLVLPADHYLKNTQRFAAAVKRGLVPARDGAIVVFGVRPTAAHTGYGYIRVEGATAESDVGKVAEFREKPDAETAARYVASGEYLWNSGMFLLRADVYLAELGRYAPDILKSAEASLAGARQDGQFLRLDAKAFRACRSESVDYAVMEHTKLARVVGLESPWSDLGSFASLLDAGAPATDENLIVGDVRTQDVSGSLVHSSGRLVTAIGLRNHVVVETPDAVFVAPRERADEVKAMVAVLENDGRREATESQRVHRPWGWYESRANGIRFQVKHIQIDPGASLSLQLHNRRSEHWVVVKGSAEVTRDDKTFRLTVDQSTYIPVGTKHRIRNPGPELLEIIEIQTGDYLGEDDIVRFEDNYGRTND